LEIDMTRHTKIQSAEKLPVEVPADALAKLKGIAERSGKSVEFLVQEALERYFEDLEDLQAAHDVLVRRRGDDSRTYPLEELVRELGLER
jgi:predicted DNA-binding protein